MRGEHVRTWRVIDSKLLSYLDWICYAGQGAESICFIFVLAERCNAYNNRLVEWSAGGLVSVTTFEMKQRV